MTRERNRKRFILLVTAIITAALFVSVVAEEVADPSQPIPTLRYQSADIRSVFSSLAEYGNVNVVVSPEVTGTVTIKLSDVQWRAAMDIIGRTYNLAVVDELDGYVRVLPAEAYRKEVTEQDKHRTEQQKLAELETRIIRISNSTSGDIVETVKSLMTTRGEAFSDERSNSIIVQEVPDNMDKVLAFISELDKPARQIKISTQILEISSDALDELGIDWSVGGAYVTNSGRSFDQTGSVLTERVSDPTANYSVTALQHGWDATAVVEAFVRSGKGKIIAHPEITTVDNKLAKIQMGKKIPIKQFDDAGNVVIKFEEVGTMLSVIPHITAENQILMHLRPERSTYEFDPNGVIINTSNAETNVIVANGQTAVIGGLTTQDELESEVGVPLLKDIPLLGVLFKYTNKRVENRDLVIFVTPTIVDADLAMGG